MGRFQSSVPPLCRCCGKAIRKTTTDVVFGRSERENARGQGRTERPANRQEAQRYVNGIIVHSRRSAVARQDSRQDTGSSTISVPSYIERVSVWDGETYQDPYFCKGTCAITFGYTMAKHSTLQTQAYADALAAQAANKREA